MVKRCYVKDCPSKFGRKDASISLHRFPVNDAALLRRWLNFIDYGSDWRPPKYAAICSLHFAPEDFKLNTTLRCLKLNATPSIKTTEPESGDDPKSDRCTCRLCACEYHCTIKHVFRDGDESYAPRLRQYLQLSIEDNDSLPHFVCPTCDKKFKQVQDFVIQVREAQCELRHRQQQPIFSHSCRLPSIDVSVENNTHAKMRWPIFGGESANEKHPWLIELPASLSVDRGTQTDRVQNEKGSMTLGKDCTLTVNRESQTEESQTLQCQKCPMQTEKQPSHTVQYIIQPSKNSVSEKSQNPSMKSNELKESSEIETKKRKLDVKIIQDVSIIGNYPKIIVQKDKLQIVQKCTSQTNGRFNFVIPNNSLEQKYIPAATDNAISKHQSSVNLILPRNSSDQHKIASIPLNTSTIQDECPAIKELPDNNKNPRSSTRSLLKFKDAPLNVLIKKEKHIHKHKKKKLTSKKLHPEVLLKNSNLKCGRCDQKFISKYSLNNHKKYLCSLQKSTVVRKNNVEVKNVIPKKESRMCNTKAK